MPQEKRLIVRVDPEFHEAVKAKAKSEDLTVSQVVRRLLREWMRDDPSGESKESQLQQN